MFCFVPRRRRPPQEFIRDITVQDDGIRPVRDAHHWTRDKLGVLQSYLTAYAKACKSAGRFFFIDGMAGPGLNLIGETGEWLLGSTLVACHTAPSFAKCLAMDLDPDNVSALTARCAPFGERAVVARGDCNQDLLPAMEREIPHRFPCFVLLDPEGAELLWSTVRDISAFRRGSRKAEMLILFATEGVNRMMPVETDIELHNEMALNRLFPPESGWRATWMERRQGAITPAEARLRYVKGYMAGLTALGYKYVLHREITRATGALVYHLVFATDDPVGETIMKDVFDQMYPNQSQLKML
ncbi:MAG: three-Cys-motif partner protein TcmP [Chloroflexi bacterium]|nr:three-Cys-motif partner protein TcmP [Chloroflexota bacterium]